MLFLNSHYLHNDFVVVLTRKFFCFFFFSNSWKSSGPSILVNKNAFIFSWTNWYFCIASNIIYRSYLDVLRERDKNNFEYTRNFCFLEKKPDFFSHEYVQCTMLNYTTHVSNSIPSLRIFYFSKIKHWIRWHSLLRAAIHIYANVHRLRWIAIGDVGTNK